MSNYSALYVGNTSIIEVDGLADQDGAYQNDATVTLETLVDKKTGAEVQGISLPLTLPYVSGSNGKYQGTIPDDVEITAGRSYSATVKAVSAAGLVAEWEEVLIAQVRRA